MSTQHGGINDSDSSQYENAVFVSYKWGGEGEEIVDQIEQALQRRGIRLIRDKRDLPYKGSIRKFMERIGHGNCVIAVINDGYLRSRHCMFELMEMAEAKQFHDRVFPIVLDDAKISDPLQASEYIRYWEGELKKLVDGTKDLDPANLQGIHDKINLYDSIRDEISELISSLNDMNTLTLELFRQGDYGLLAEAIVERTLSNDLIPQKEILDRRLDVAMPKECQVGRRTEVRVLIALPESKGLQAFLPDYTVSRELIARADVEKTGVPIEFPYDENTGQLQPGHLHAVIDAPDFQVRQPIQQIFVPPDKDSGTLTFSLTPRKPLSIGRVSVKLYLDKDCLIGLGSVTLTTTVSSKQVEGIAGSWQLASFPPTPSILIAAGSSASATGQIDLHSDNRPTDSRQSTRNRWNWTPAVVATIFVGILGALATIIAPLVPEVFDRFNNTPIPPITPSPTSLCMSTKDILVKVHVLGSNDEEITTLTPGATFAIEPGLTVFLQTELISVDGIDLPAPKCNWTNAGRATDGKLLHDEGCKIDYQGGREKIIDSISLQLSQPSCSALPPYVFFISATK